MKYSKILALCLFAAVFAFAQDSRNSTNSTKGASGTASASGSPEGEAIFDSPLRSHFYNLYSIVGAATSIEDMAKTPSDIYGQKFFYISPTDNAGFASFDFLGGSTFLGLANNPARGGSLAALKLGYATPAFGLFLDYAISKEWTSNNVGSNDMSQRTTYPGDKIALNFSLPLGSAKLYAGAGWLTYDVSYARNVDGDEWKLDYSEIGAVVGFTSAFGSLGYDAYLVLDRYGGTLINPDGKKATEAGSYFATGLGFDLGYAALKSSSARVIVGLNNFFSVSFIDDVKKIQKSDSQIGLSISPNILAEVALCENWLAFVGATHALALNIGDGDGQEDTSRSAIKHDDETQTYIGARYQKNRWAFEAQVSANVFRNPFGGFNGETIFTQFGGFIYF